MFGQEKVLERVEKFEGDVKKLKSDVKELKESLSENNKHLTKISDMLKEVCQGQNNLQLSSEKAVKDIESKAENFDRVIRKLDQTNLELSQKTFSKISTVVDDELSKIKTDVLRYNSLKEEISEITKHLDFLKTQIGIMGAVSSKIKEKDFELVNYADRIDKLEKEKLRAEQESERVKDILAKMSKQRGNFVPRRNFTRPPQNNRPSN